MAVNRKRHAVDTAADERWALLGLRLRARRIELGYPVRKAFARAKGLTTDRGAENVRMINAMENNERPGTYAPGRLEQFARAYEVTAESVYALLDGKTDELEPSGPVASRGLPSAPQSGLLRETEDRPYLISVWDRLWDLAYHGVADPSGAQLGLDGEAADFWDSNAHLRRGDRSWALAIFLRLRDARETDGRAGANSA